RLTLSHPPSYDSGTVARRFPVSANDRAARRPSPRNRPQFSFVFPVASALTFQPCHLIVVQVFQCAKTQDRMVRIHRLGKNSRTYLRGWPHSSCSSGELEARTHLLQRAALDPNDLSRDGALPVLDRC